MEAVSGVHSSVPGVPIQREVPRVLGMYRNNAQMRRAKVTGTGLLALSEVAECRSCSCPGISEERQSP